MTVKSSVIKYRRRNRGQPIKIEREVWFKGNVYTIEEEIYSDSDKSSVYTSEDDYRQEDDIQNMFAERFPLLNKNNERSNSNATYNSEVQK